jgi:hypothetical protein
MIWSRKYPPDRRAKWTKNWQSYAARGRLAAAGLSPRRIGRQQKINGFEQLSNLFAYDTPNHLRVCAIVIVDQNIPQIVHLTPLDDGLLETRGRSSVTPLR